MNELLATCTRPFFLTLVVWASYLYPPICSHIHSNSNPNTSPNRTDPPVILNVEFLF